jgi:hypothetical protein
MLSPLKRLGIVMLLFVVCTSFIDQRSDSFVFTGYFGKEQLVRGKNYFCASKGDSISVSTCRFYISDIVLKEGTTVAGTYTYKLIDLFDTARSSFVFPCYAEGNITEISFNLGIDSTTNVSGAKGGDLDPTKGMYWAWQSGYINLKLEGKSNVCKKSRGEYQYHLGGYAAPNNALQRVVLKANNDHGDFCVNVDVEKFFAAADMQAVSNVMSPSANAVKLSAHAAQMFSLPE